MAGRSHKTKVDYYPHYARHGSKMAYLERKYGNDGYAVWFKIMDKLALSDNHHFSLLDEVDMMMFADRCLVDEDRLVSIIEFLVKTGWLHEKLWIERRILCSAEFIENIQDAYLRRKNDCINVQALELMYDINTQTILKKTKEEETKEDKTKGSDDDCIVEVWPTFDDFWDLYDKKIDRPKCERKWKRLDQKTREAIMAYLPEYVRRTSEKRFRRNPYTFLNNNTWENDYPEERTKVNERKSNNDIAASAAAKIISKRRAQRGNAY